MFFSSSPVLDTGLFCVRRLTRQFRLVLVVLAVLLQISDSHAQDKAYGVRAGLAAISNGEGNHGIFEAFYDVPMGPIMFSPELDLITAHAKDPAYGLSMMFRLPVYRGDWTLLADAGGQFVVWDTITTPGGPPKRAHAGIPLRLAAEVPFNRPAEFEVTLTYTLLFFLGAEPYSRSLFGVLAGIRILVP